MVRPLLKWAGGKRQLLPELSKRLPHDFNSYWEPFLGGAALFFHLSERQEGLRAILSDINPAICLFYKTVRDRADDLIEYAATLCYANSSSDFYEARARFNSIDGNKEPVEKSGLLLYLNRHCFNGLYRVNSKGEFNVPFGSYIKPRMPSDEEILAASKSLNKTEIRHDDFQEVLAGATGGDFVYLDPPYEPISNSSSFTAYSKGGFGREHQERLSKVMWDLDSKGVKFMLSNSGNSFLKELYSGFRIMPVEARRNINSIGNGRGSVREIIVTNY